VTPTATPTATPVLPDLQISQTVERDDCQFTICYTTHITIENPSDAAATGIKLAWRPEGESVPVHVVDIQQGVCPDCDVQNDQSDEVLICTGGTLGRFEQQQITVVDIQWQPSQSGMVRRTAEVDPDNTIFESDEQSNNSQTLENHAEAGELEL
jgi:hypothetical protein